MPDLVALFGILEKLDPEPEARDPLSGTCDPEPQYDQLGPGTPEVGR